MKHNITLAYPTRSDPVSGRVQYYRATCVCEWTGSMMRSKFEAYTEGIEHCEAGK